MLQPVVRPRWEHFHAHENVAGIRIRAPQPGHATNLRAMPCRGNGEPNRRVRAGTKSRGPSEQVRAALASLRKKAKEQVAQGPRSGPAALPEVRVLAATQTR
jgi:hypothetical protein